MKSISRADKADFFFITNFRCFLKIAKAINAKTQKEAKSYNRIENKSILFDIKINY
jgi:hypothetical protein